MNNGANREEYFKLIDSYKKKEDDMISFKYENMLRYFGITSLSELRTEIQNLNKKIDEFDKKWPVQSEEDKKAHKRRGGLYGKIDEFEHNLPLQTSDYNKKRLEDQIKQLNKLCARDKDQKQIYIDEREELVAILKDWQHDIREKDSGIIDNKHKIEKELNNAKKELNELQNKIYFGIDTSQFAKDRVETLKEVIHELEEKLGNTYVSGKDKKEVVKPENVDTKEKEIKEVPEEKKEEPKKEEPMPVVEEVKVVPLNEEEPKKDEVKEIEPIQVGSLDDSDKESVATDISSKIEDAINESNMEKEHVDNIDKENIIDIVYLANKLKELNPDVKIKIGKPSAKDYYGSIPLPFTHLNEVEENKIVDNIYISGSIDSLKVPEGFYIENGVLTNKGNTKEGTYIECMLKDIN